MGSQHAWFWSAKISSVFFANQDLLGLEMRKLVRLVRLFIAVLLAQGSQGLGHTSLDP